MSELSAKELSAIQDLLSDEQLLTKKFQMLSEHTQDPAIKQKYQEISAKHQEHFNRLYEKLN